VIGDRGYRGESGNEERNDPKKSHKGELKRLYGVVKKSRRKVRWSRVPED